MLLFSSLVACIFVAALLFYRSRQFVGQDPHRAARNQMKEFAKAWAVLAALYAIAWGLHIRGFPTDLPVPGDAPDPKPGEYVWHLIVMMFCTATNFLIRKAAVMLEFPDQDFKRIEYPHIPHELRKRARGAIDWIAEEGLALGFVLSVLILVLDFAFDTERTTWAFALAYAVNLVVSMAVMIRLAKAYWFASGSRVLSLPTLCYGVLQFLYMPGNLWGAKLIPSWPDWFGWVFLAAKPIFGLTIFLSAGHLLDAIQSTGAGALDAPGHRFKGIARLHSLIRTSVTAACAAMIVVGLIAIRESTLRPGIFYLALVASPIALQLVVYLSRYVFADRVKYEFLCASTLVGRYHVDARRELGAQWTAQRITNKPAGPSAETQIILVHGLFSSSERTWGLLPLILLDGGGMHSIQLLDYRTSLLSTENDFKKLSDELAAHIEDLTLAHPGPTVVLAHSLGSILLMRALTELSGTTRHSVLSRIHRAVFIGSPVEGSPRAWLAAPWPVYWALRYRAAFVVDALENFAAQFPPLGHIVGEESQLPAVSFVCGTRDEIAGTMLEALGPPGRVVQLPGWHSIATVFEPNSAHARRFLAEAKSPSRDLLWVRVVAAHYLPRDQRECRLIFSVDGVATIEQAKVVGKVVTRKHQIIEFDDDETWECEQSTLLAKLRESWDRHEHDLANVSSEEAWEEFVSRLGRGFVRSRAYLEVMRLDWGTDHTCVLYCGERVGFVAIQRTMMQKLRVA